MDGVRLADRLAYGAGCVARRVGFLHDAYRPAGPACPIDPALRFLRLAVAFVLPGGALRAPSALGVPYRQAWADWSYLAVGDYLVGPEGVAFVASIEPPKPMLVVMTNATVRLCRPAAPVQAGLNGYSAVLPTSERVLLQGFPVSLAMGGVEDRTRAGLADDTKLPGFTVLMPALGEVRPGVADILRTESGESFVVNGAVLVGGVWRLSLDQAVS
jgi:hypothetical protein